MAESIITRKVSGGSSLDKVVEEYIVNTGNTISAGTFVDYVANNGVGDRSTVRAFTTTNFLTGIVAIKLSDNKVLLYYPVASPGPIFRVLNFNNNTITYGQEYSINLGADDSRVLLTRITSDKVFAMGTKSSGSFKVGFVRILTINGDVVSTVGSDYIFTGTSNSSFTNNQPFEHFNTLQLDSTRFLLLYRRTNNNISAGIIINIASNNTITQGPETNLGFVNQETPIGVLIDANKVAIFWKYQGSVATISGTTISNNTARVTVTPSTNTFIRAALYLGNNKIIVLTSINNEAGVQFYVITNTNDVLSFPTASTGRLESNTFGNQRVYNAFASLLNSSTILFCYNVGITSGSVRLTGAIVQIKNNLPFYTVAPFEFSTVARSSSFSGFNCLSYIDNKGVVIYYEETNNNIYAKNLDYQIKAINPTGDSVFGLAKTGGTAGQTIEVYVNKET
jgi:hypothetical protein